MFVVCDAEKTEEVINSGMFEHKGRITSEVRAQVTIIFHVFVALLFHTIIHRTENPSKL